MAPVAATVVVPDGAALVEASAAQLLDHLARAVGQRGQAFLALTGGRTPQPLYERLADAAGPWRPAIDWPRVHVFWGDERHVPPESPESNYGMARRTLLAQVPIPSDQIHRIPAELADARDAARDYDRAIREACRRTGRQAARMDLVMLGIGADAHIASIFPASPLLDAGSQNTDELCAAVWVPALRAWRLTLTPKVLLDAAAILVIAEGSAKAAAVHAALVGPLDLPRYPAQLLRTAGARVTWILDEDAASRL